MDKKIKYRVNLFEQNNIVVEDGKVKYYNRGPFKALFRWIPFLKNWGKSYNEHNMEDILVAHLYDSKCFFFFKKNFCLISDSLKDSNIQMKPKNFRNLIEVLDKNKSRVIHETNRRVISHDDILDNTLSQNPKTIRDHSIWIYEDLILGVNPNGEVDRVVPSEARFFNASKGNKGKVNLYFGYQGQIDYPNATQEESDYVHNHLVKNESPIGRSPESVFKMEMKWWMIRYWFKPKYWKIKEEIKLYSSKNNLLEEKLDDALDAKTGAAIAYTRRNGKKRENIYLPISEIVFSSLKRRRLEILGEQNINPVFKVPQNAVNPLKNQLRDKLNVLKGGGKIAPSSWCFPQAIRCKNRIYLAGEYILFTYGKKENYFFKPDNINVWYGCKRYFFDLFGRVVVVGDDMNIRKDQSSTGRTIIIKGVFRPKSKGKSILGTQKMVSLREDKKYYKDMMY